MKTATYALFSFASSEKNRVQNSLISFGLKGYSEPKETAS
jgi:hypothetical protein